MRKILAVLALVAMATGTAGAAELTPARVPELRGWMYATVLDRDERIQLLVRICRRPQWETRCRPMTVGLRTAIEREFGGELTWVHRMWPQAGVYWVLSPIRFRLPRARFNYAWQDPSPAGCAGHGLARYKRGLEGWQSLGGPGGVGCP